MPLRGQAELTHVKTDFRRPSEGESRPCPGEASGCDRVRHRAGRCGPAARRPPRDEWEASVTLSDERLDAMFPRSARRVLVAHTRPEPLLGLLRLIDGGPGRLRAHGFQNRGGTLDLFGMLFANRCTFAHLVRSAAALVGVDEARLLTAAERSALDGAGDPQALHAGAGLALGQVDDRAAGPG